MKKVDRIRELVAEDSISEALDLLMGKESEIIHLKSRWNGLQREIRNGIIAEQDANLQKNRIRRALLALTNKMEKEYPNEKIKVKATVPPPPENNGQEKDGSESEEIPIPEGGTFLPFFKKYLIYTFPIILILIAIGIWLPIKFDPKQDSELDTNDLKTNVVKIESRGGGYDEIGAGIILGKNNQEVHILTAWHVIELDDNVADSITVYFFQDSKAYLAEAKNYNSSLDIAIISVKNVPKIFSHLGTSKEIIRAQKVWTVGHPLNDGWRIPAEENIVNDPSIAKDTRTFALKNEEIYPGSSGGPVFNQQHQLIGIITDKNLLDAIGVKLSEIQSQLKKWGIYMNYIE